MKTEVKEPVHHTIDLGYSQKLVTDYIKTSNKGLKFTKSFSSKKHPYSEIKWIRKDVVIPSFDPTKPAYERLNVEVPDTWGDLAIQITCSKYLFGSKPNTPEYEDSFKNVFDRIANTYTLWGWKHDYFKSEKDAVNFNWDIKYMLVNQMWAPNSPVWFNIGLWEQWRWNRPDLRNILDKKGLKAYKATLPQGLDLTKKMPTNLELEIKQLSNPYINPQASACFLLKVEDSMESILSHYKAEGGVFASGSGVGMNIASLRSSHEPISGRGQSSGPISFDRGWDTSAGAVKSGGATRRAARMIVMYADHPDIFDFIKAKKCQEDIGKIILQEHNVFVELVKLALSKKDSKDKEEKALSKFILDLPQANDIIFSNNMDDLLYGCTLQHQNSNHSVSFKGDFWKAYKEGKDYNTKWITDPSHIHETFKAVKLIDDIADSIYENAEPGIHNNDIINLWNPVKSDGNINTSNPCSEYFFLENTSCNLSSFNVYTFYNNETKTFDFNALSNASRLAMIVADLNIEEGGFPVPEIANGTYLYRTTGIGFANIGGLLMALGIPYDSDRARYIAGQLTSFLTSSCYKASSEMGLELGVYPRYENTKTDLKEVLELHKVCQEFTSFIPNSGTESLEQKANSLFNANESKLPVSQETNGMTALKGLLNSYEEPGTFSSSLPSWVKSLRKESKSNWDYIVQQDKFRNSFVTCIAPTGTISGPMGIFDKGTTSAEPEYSLVKTKKLSGGGHLTMFNQIALEGLKTLGYSENQVKEAALEVAGIAGLLLVSKQNFTLAAEHLNNYKPEQMGPIRESIEYNFQTFATGVALEKFVLEGQLFKLDTELKPLFEGLGTVESIPWLNPEHVPVFDCSVKAPQGTRSLSYRAHLRMLGAVQPFISGATSKTTNLPITATKEDIKNCLIECHDMGIKCVALFKDGSKAISVYQSKEQQRKQNPALIWQDLEKTLSTLTSSIKEDCRIPKRTKLPGRRPGQVVKFKMSTLDGYLQVGVYPDGRCGEVFGVLGKAGSFTNGMFDAYCKLFSMALQYNIPLSEITPHFRFMSFEPSGFCNVGDINTTDNTEGRSDIKSAKSIIDLMMQILEWLFPDGTIKDNGGIESLKSPTDKFQNFSVETLMNELKEKDLSNEQRELIDSTLTDLFDSMHSQKAVQEEKLQTPKLQSIYKHDANGTAMACPKCGSLEYVSDGKCRSCRNCLYKDGGCGE